MAGLERNTRYRVSFEVEIATNVPNGCAGVGGAPGESVTVKGGASAIEPAGMPLAGDSFLRMNVDKGEQTMGGANAVVLGDVANSVPCEDPAEWELKPLSSDGGSIEVTTDSVGAVWLFVGTDSGFEATTSLYYTSVVASLAPS